MLTFAPANIATFICVTVLFAAAPLLASTSIHNQGGPDIHGASDGESDDVGSNVESIHGSDDVDSDVESIHESDDVDSDVDSIHESIHKSRRRPGTAARRRWRSGRRVQHRRGGKHNVAPVPSVAAPALALALAATERCDAASLRRVVDATSWLRVGLAERHGAFKIAANSSRWQKLVHRRRRRRCRRRPGRGAAATPRSADCADAEAIASGEGVRVWPLPTTAASIVATVNFSMQTGPVAECRGPKTIRRLLDRRVRCARLWRRLIEVNVRRTASPTAICGILHST